LLKVICACLLSNYNIAGCLTCLVSNRLSGRFITAQIFRHVGRAEPG
jgi:hypothetical protein